MKTYLTLRASIAADSTTQICVRCPGGPIRPHTLRVVKVDPCSNDFDILDIKVGNKSQLERPMPAEHFRRARLQHIDAMAAWLEENGAAWAADAIRRGDWRTKDTPPDDEDGVEFPCDTLQSSMDFTMVVKNRDPYASAEFCAVWTCEAPHPSWTDFSTWRDIYAKYSAGEAADCLPPDGSRDRPYRTIQGAMTKEQAPRISFVLRYGHTDLYVPITLRQGERYHVPFSCKLDSIDAHAEEWVLARNKSPVAVRTSLVIGDVLELIPHVRAMETPDAHTAALEAVRRERFMGATGSVGPTGAAAGPAQIAEEVWRSREKLTGAEAGATIDAQIDQLRRTADARITEEVTPAMPETIFITFTSDEDDRATTFTLAPIAGRDAVSIPVAGKITDIYQRSLTSLRPLWLVAINGVRAYVRSRATAGDRISLIRVDPEVRATLTGASYPEAPLPPISKEIVRKTESKEARGQEAPAVGWDPYGDDV